MHISVSLDMNVFCPVFRSVANEFDKKENNNTKRNNKKKQTNEKKQK